MVNLQQVEKWVMREDGALEVVDVFYTIQGEGPYAGVPAVFARLAGCVLRCPACDTDYTSNRRLVPVADLVREVRGLSAGPVRQHAGRRQRPLVVLTGGEPLRQACGRFIRALLNEGYRVQVETSGAVWDESLNDARAWNDLMIGCSPKTPALDKELLKRVDYFKYVVAAGHVDPLDGLPTSALGMSSPPARPPASFMGEAYVQPQDDQDPVKNAANMRVAVESCLAFGYRLSLQLHKICGLP